MSGTAKPSSRVQHLACFLLALVLSSQLVIPPVSGQGIVTGGGSWRLLSSNAGIPAMHAAVTRFNNVILLDRTDVGPSQINLANGKCRDDPNDQTLTHDCTAHSVIFDPDSNTVRPVEVLTDTWCSSGQFVTNGTLIQTGGDFDGNQKVRQFTPCPSSGTCDWVEEPGNELQVGRWYSTNQLLPDNSIVIVGGRGVYTYEFIPANGRPTFDLPLLHTTQDPGGLNDNYYPYVHLLPDGNLFIFANRDSVLLNYVTNTVVRTYPTIPGEPRNYPSAGSSVMLPLDGATGYTVAEIVVCGGSEYGAYHDYNAQYPASNTCGRMTATSTSPNWVMETMPIRRNMGDMILLPTRNVLIINGAQQGSQGWGGVYGNATLNPVTYLPNAASGSRFLTYAASTIPRVYHSTANLLPDGRILVAGSNSHQYPTYTGIFPTELRLESFSPPYLQSAYSSIRPGWQTWPGAVAFGQTFTITINVVTPPAGLVEVNFISCPFVTHSFAQGQRLLKLVVGKPTPTAIAQRYSVSVTAPPNGIVAPSSWYMAFLNNNGIPSRAVWIHVG
ncbi:unnamed protein product [Calypogeia fissa]